MTAVSIRKDYLSRLDSSDVVSVTKVLKLHILERKLNFGEYGTRGNMGDFPISSGGGQFTFVPLTLWYKFATRGCRWICYSNLRSSNRSKVQTSDEFLFALEPRHALAQVADHGQVWRDTVLVAYAGQAVRAVAMQMLVVHREQQPRDELWLADHDLVRARGGR